MTSTIYIVVKYFGNNSIVGCQKLDTMWFVKSDADERAKRMQRRHHWIWRVIPVEIDLSGEGRKIIDELKARGIPAS